ncbi:cardiolipin synthase [Maribacter cobaltidurans]|uniref:Cardiolipin synthase n=1 Tax=Maribacter cobaltidurans TaxID=1178778 RepID=A0A223V5R0_9FLAO|nr:cardiolipin synthase [Maribacter cobaltidurans]ASV30764.1 cardiolipin synthase [Maribacter cobaltidurans]GGD81549.1 cardiolipin synthase 2 [Maribacter cobaltidurans]
MNTILWIAYLLVTIWSIVNIIFYGMRSTKMISWSLTVIILPFLGPILYYLFGINRRKFKLFKLKQTEKRKLYSETYKELKGGEKSVHDFDNYKHDKIASLIRKNSYFAPYEGNKIELLNDGEEAFGAIFKAIEKAEKFIHVQYYILEEGDLLDRFYDLFSKKVKEGVEIRMLYDSLGSHSLRGKVVKRFKDIGVKAFSSMPIRFGNLLFTLNYRNHRKIVVIDGKIGFTGGFNVSDKYINPISDLGLWQDLHLRLEGPVVNSLQRVFIKDYHFAGDEDLLLKDTYFPKIEAQGTSIAQVVSSGPDSKYPAIMQQYLAMINSAKKSICIANPYFIPGMPVREALQIAALSGIEVNLLTPKVSDSLLAKYSMFSGFEALLDVGANIYLRPDFSHSKVIIIDGEIASVGSGNFDYRSFEHNFETNVLVYDKEIAQKIEKFFFGHCKKEILLKKESFKKRSIYFKFMEGLAKFFSPLL